MIDYLELSSNFSALLELLRRPVKRKRERERLIQRRPMDFTKANTTELSSNEQMSMPAPLPVRDITEFISLPT
jgi:hypothetical protein